MINLHALRPLKTYQYSQISYINIKNISQESALPTLHQRNFITTNVKKLNRNIRNASANW